jgi:hypothetical protein
VSAATEYRPRCGGGFSKAFELYHPGDSQADIREGQDFPKLWAKWHYDFPAILARKFGIPVVVR